jgi:putative hydrolase of the HAD superfamily
MIRAVTFDVGGTLIEPYPSVGHVYAAVAAEHGRVIPPEELNRRFCSAWGAKKQFRHSREDWAMLVDETFGDLVSKGATRNFFDELYQRFALPACWRVFEDVQPALDDLRSRGVRLGVISNWDERLRPLLNRLGLDEYFESIVISCEAGSCKPAAEIFKEAIRHFGFEPDSILHVGDSLSEDVKGAEASEMRALLIDRSAPASKGVISSLTQIPSVAGL